MIKSFLQSGIVFACLSLSAVLPAQPNSAQPSISASTCSVVVLNSAEARVRVDGCGRSVRDVAAFKVLEERLNALVQEERLQGRRLEDIVAGLNLWFPALSAQLDAVQSEVRQSIADATRQIIEAIKTSKTSAELSTAFLAAAERKIAGSPLSRCACDNPVETTDPYQTFSVRAPNSLCLSGYERYEACVSQQEETCRTKTWNKGYPPFRRICS